MTSIRVLLGGLIDYAGLFPPAGLDMTTAVRNYANYRLDEDGWALGRFVVPVQRLPEFTASFAEACCDEQGSPWLLNVLSSGDTNKDAELIGEFSEGAAYLDAIEIKAADAIEATQMLTAVPSGMIAYIEFAAEQSEQILPILKKSGARAKIRTGGVTPEAFPSSEELAHFLVSCANAEVLFKATAGMHHPLRSVRKLTYESASASTLMHGFINIFVAATIAYLGTPSPEVQLTLEEQSPTAFQWSGKELAFHDHRISAELIKSVRDNFAISFGSCSFTEPIGDLKTMGWL